MRKCILTALFCGTFAFRLCSGFSDEVPKGQITTRSYCRAEQHAVPATNAIYNYLIMGYPPGGLWGKDCDGVFYNDYWALQGLFSDNINNQQVSIRYASVSNTQIDQYNEPIELLWRDFYQTIKRHSVAVDRASAIDMDDILKGHLIAGAKFSRGMMYFDSIRMFSGVPLQEHNLESADEGSMVWVSKDEIYKLVFEDLTTAKTDLKYPPGYGGGRPYPESASTLSTRVYLTYAAEHNDTEYYELAVKEAGAVIPKFPMLRNYADLFKISNRFNSEIIWGANFSASLSDDWIGAQFLVRLLPNMDGMDSVQGWESTTGNLYSSFNANDVRLPVVLECSVTYQDGTVKQFVEPYVSGYWDQEAEPKGNSTDAIFPAIRTAEMYLIKAEALNAINQGPTPDVVKAIEEVKDRTGLASDNLPTNYEGLGKVVFEEYRHELVVEGHRWFDLTRMRTPQEFVDIIKAARPDATPQLCHVEFPIPQRERDLSQGRITQNEGYNQQY